MLRTQAVVTHLEKFPASRAAAVCTRAQHYGSCQCALLVLQMTGRAGVFE
jgi:hypothetical protein